MPSVSIAQRRLFAIARHHPDELSSANKGLAKLPASTLDEFARTPEKGLPKHKSGAMKRMAAMGRKGK